MLSLPGIFGYLHRIAKFFSKIKLQLSLRIFTINSRDICKEDKILSLPKIPSQK